MSNQEVADSRVLRNSLTSLSPFPFKSCSERIIDFPFLSAHNILDQIKDFGCHFTLLDWVLPGRDWELVKQRNKLLNFSTNFRNKSSFQTLSRQKYVAALCGLQ